MKNNREKRKKKSGALSRSNIRSNIKLQRAEVKILIPIYVIIILFASFLFLFPVITTPADAGEGVNLKLPQASARTLKPLLEANGTKINVNSRPPTPGPASDKELVKQRICEVFGPYCSQALIIAQRESGFNTNAYNASGSMGVFQINCPSHRRRVGGDCSKLYNMNTNIQIAYDIFREQGYSWNAWSTKIYLK